MTDLEKANAWVKAIRAAIDAQPTPEDYWPGTNRVVDSLYAAWHQAVELSTWLLKMQDAKDEK